MNGIVDDVREMLQDDMLNHADLVHYVRYRCGDDVDTVREVASVLEHVLQTGEIEIGNARLIPTRDYVEFVAWRGTVQDRVKRALEAVEAADEMDKHFAYWLTFRRNVDRYEDEHRGD